MTSQIKQFLLGLFFFCWIGVSSIIAICVITSMDDAIIVLTAWMCITSIGGFMAIVFWSTGNESFYPRPQSEEHEDLETDIIVCADTVDEQFV